MTGSRLAFFVSGSGTNMENLVREIQAGKIQGDAAVVICDKPGAKAIERCRDLGVECAVVDRKQYKDKESFEEALIRETEARQIDWLVLAGFMRILSDRFVNHFKGRIINIHPSYLPAFKGAHAIRDAFEAGVKETGVTTHFVEPDVDAGPVILQRKVSVEPGETLESLEEKIHAVEYEIYPETLRLVLSGKVKYGS